MKYLFYILFLGSAAIGSSKLYEHFPDPSNTAFFWEVSDAEPFNELELTWNAQRTAEDGFYFFVSLKQGDEWSPMLYYGQWGSWGQMLFQDSPEDSLASTRRGIVSSRKGKCDGFKIYVQSDYPIDSLSAFTNAPTPPTSEPQIPILLANPDRQSLITLRCDRYTDHYLTTAVSIAVNTLFQHKKINPVDFAQNAYDQENDAYNHWNLSAAQAFVALEGKYTVQVQKLPDFETLYSYLARGTPVVVGIQGTIMGAPRPYYREHAVCVIGYDPTTKKVHCIDPFFPNDKATPVSYSLSDFTKAWNKRQNIACTFKL